MGQVEVIARIAKLVTLVTIAAAALCGTVGCAARTEESDLTLLESKAIAQQVEREIVDVIPNDIVLSVDQRATGSLLSCKGERNFQWAGGTTVEPLEDADLVAIIDHITEVYSSIEGWELTRKQATAGYPKLLLDHPQFGNYIVSGWSDPAVINVFSFSPCFHLPDDVSPHGLY